MKSQFISLCVLVASVSAVSASASTVREQWHNKLYSVEVMSDGSASIFGTCQLISIPSGEWNEEGRSMKATIGGGPVPRPGLATPTTVSADLSDDGDFTLLELRIGGESVGTLTYGPSENHLECL